MQRKDKYQYIIKLAPAIGDWTRIKLPHRDTEEISITQVKDFSFDRISQTDLKKAHFFHYYFAQDWTENIARDLNIKTVLHSITAKQISLSGFMEAIEPKMLQVDFYHPELGKFNIFLSYSFAETIINRIFGGKGQAVGKMNFTEIEKGALKIFFEEEREAFFKLWPVIKDKDKINIEVKEIEDIVDRSISEKESYISFGVCLAIGEEEPGEIIVGYGQNVFKQLLQKKRSIIQKKQRKIYLNRETLNKIKVPIVFEIGTTKISMIELQRLQKGDVVKLDSPINDPILVTIGDKVNFLGQPGVTEERIAVQLILPEIKKTRKLEKAIVVEKESPLLEVKEEVRQKGEKALKEEKKLEEEAKEEFAEDLEEIKEKKKQEKDIFEEEEEVEEEEKEEEEEEEEEEGEDKEEEEDELFDDEDFSWDDIDDSEEF